MSRGRVILRTVGILATVAGIATSHRPIARASTEMNASVQSADGQIAGRVTNDNGDPLGGVVVAIYTSTAYITSATTNAAGDYITDAILPTGTYYARTFNAQGYLEQLFDGFDCVGYCDITIGTPISVISGGSEAVTANIDFGLAAGSRIAGKVTAAGSTTPLANVTVDIFDANGFLVSYYTTTNAAGEYLTGPGLPHGTYFAKTWNTQGYIDELYDNMPCAPCFVTEGTPIVIDGVPAGVETIANINFALAAGGRIAGRVTDAATGAPIEDVMLEIFNSAGIPMTTTLTDVAGNYITGTGLPTGTYYARTMNALGYVDELYNNIVCLNCSVTTGNAITVIAGAGATTININFALAEGGQVAGRVTNASTGAGVPNVLVAVHLSPTAYVRATTDAAGNYLTEQGLPTGTYFARTFNAAGLLDELYDNLPCLGYCNVISGTPISVTAGGGALTTGNINFALAPGGRIAGRVTDVFTGGPLANVTVDIYNSAGTLVSYYTMTNGSGDYVSGPGLPAGTYYARTFNGRGYVDELYDNIPCASCNVTTGTPITVTLDAAAPATTGNINFALARENCAVAIDNQPDSQTIGWRQQGSLYVGATGCNLTYQWYLGTSGTTTNPIAGATFDFYITPPLTQNTSYWVRVSNALGSIDSQTATITIGTTPLIVAGLTPAANHGGWMGVRRGAAGNFGVERWLQVPWPNYNAAGGPTHPAVGDVDGDGLDEIVVGLGQGSNGWIAVFDDARHGYALLGWIQLPWAAYNASNGEVYPGVGDLDHDGKAEIVAGLGPGGGDFFAIFEGADANFAFVTWQRVNWGATSLGDGSTHPAVGDVDNDGWADIILGFGAGAQGKLEIRHAANGGYANKRWIQVGWPSYNAQNGATYPATDGSIIVVGLGQGGNGWLETIGVESSDYAHIGWLRISWEDYNTAVGETHPALGDLDGFGDSSLVVGLAPYGTKGGWFEVINPDSGQSRGWKNLDWTSFRLAGGGIWPAIGKLK